MRIRNVLLAAATVALPLAAQAQPVTGLYVGGGLGINYLQPESIGSGGG
jgi:OOP family OmpA-OmpF porin